MLGEHLNSTESHSLLTTIDKMREVLHGERVTLREIIPGIQLSRAQNISTRCPLVLRMKTA
jgi:hypothetical protein